MELKLFGKNIFEFKSSKSSMYFEQSSNRLKESEFLPDFNTMQAHGHDLSDYIVAEGPEGDAVLVPKNKKKGVTLEITPKGVHELKLLNEDTFKINVDPEYVDGQLQDFKDKLNLMKVTEFDMTRGINEIASVIARMENRKKYKKFKTFYGEFPYTTSSRIVDLVEKHKHLRLGKVEQFLADMPKEAVTVMKRYNAETKNLCDKKAVFYIIANKKDFEKTEKRRDPILLAQSPFGHFWQILGAWDEEMLLLEEL